MNYCAYQERCHQEVRKKMREWKVPSHSIEVVISELIQQNFLNEERFAKAFAGGKFRTKRWGRNRIKRELKQRNISDYCINKAMEEIDNTDYINTLEAEIDKLSERYRSELNNFKRNGKVASVLTRKGYEPSLIWDCIKQRT